MIALVLFSVVAQFEGVLNYEIITQNGGGGGSVLSISSAGMKVQTDLTMHGTQIKTVMLHNWKTPDVSYQLDETAKTYKEIDLAAARKNQQPRTYTVKTIGTDTIAGYKATHVTATEQSGVTFDIWVTKEIASEKQMRKAFSQANDGLIKALDEAGVAGVFAKFANGQMSMTLVKVEKRKLDSAFFALPAGYTKQEPAKAGASGMPAGTENLPPEVQAKIREALEKRQKAAGQ